MLDFARADSLSRSSLSLMVSNKTFDALIEGIRASKILREQKRKQTSSRVEASLRKAFSGITYEQTVEETSLLVIGSLLEAHSC